MSISGCKSKRRYDPASRCPGAEGQRAASPTNRRTLALNDLRRIRQAEHFLHRYRGMSFLFARMRHGLSFPHLTCAGLVSGKRHLRRACSRYTPAGEKDHPSRETSAQNYVDNLLVRNSIPQTPELHASPRLSTQMKSAGAEARPSRRPLSYSTMLRSGVAFGTFGQGYA